MIHTAAVLVLTATMSLGGALPLAGPAEAATSSSSLAASPPAAAPAALAPVDLATTPTTFDPWSFCEISTGISEVDGKTRKKYLHTNGKTYTRWTGPIDFATGDSLPKRADYRSTTANPWTFAMIAKAINRCWNGSTLYISPMHEVNGFWFPYGSCRGKDYCQISQAEYKAYFRAFKVALLAAVKPAIRPHMLFVNATNFGSHTKSGVNWVHGDIRGWIVPEADIIGVSIYDAVRDKAGQRLSFPSFQGYQWGKFSPVGPDSWLRIATAYRKKLAFREWGAQSTTWLRGMKLWLKAHNKQIAYNAYLYVEGQPPIAPWIKYTLA